MADLATNTGPATTERRSRWMFAIGTTSLVTIAGFGLAIFLFVQKYLYDQSAHARTVGGVLFMLLGVVGLCLPMVLLRNRRRFLSLRPSRQWLLAAGIPLAFVSVLAVCWEASLRSANLILPRPFTPTAVVRYDPGDSRVEFRGGWRPVVGPGGSNDAEVQNGTEHFSSYLHQGFIRHPDRETIAIVGRAKKLNEGTVQIILDVEAKESVRFSVENLDDVTITRDGHPLGESDSQSGTFQMTITGRPKKHAEPGAAADPPLKAGAGR